MPDLRARSNVELLDVTFELYRKHFALFFAITTLGLAPVVTASMLVENNDATGIAIIAALLALAGVFFLAFSEGIIAVATSRAYLGENIDLGNIISTALAKPVRLFFAIWLKWVLIGFGFVLLLVPGAMLLVRYFAVPTTTVLENLGVSAGRRRSSELSKGYGWRIFGLLAPAWICYFLISTLLEAGGQFSESMIIRILLSVFVAGLIYPIIPIIQTLLYYDLRIRKEGFDIERMANEIPDESPVAVA